MINIGITIIITQSKLFNPIRIFFCKINPNFLGILISCSLCTGFWSGVFTSLLFFSPTLMINPSTFLFFKLLFDGSISSIACFTFYLLIKPLLNKFD